MSDSTFARLGRDEAITRLKSGVDSLVVCHVRPDADALGSALAVCLLLRAMDCRALCVCQHEIPERLRFLVGDMQESILVDRLPADFVPEQIIAVDTASPAQMGTLYETYRGAVTLMIDHHGKGEMYADGWICPDAAATGEMIYDLACAMVESGIIPALPAGIERLLYAAISSDTGCFRYANVTPETHRCAAEILELASRNGSFAPADINHRLFEVKSPKLLLAEKLGFDRLHLFAEGRVGIVDFPAALKKAHELSDEHLETLVDIPRGMEGVQVAAAIRQPSDEPVFRVSMRSSCHVDVSAVCATFGGGGHVRAAGCSLRVPTMEDAVNAVAEAILRAMGE